MNPIQPSPAVYVDGYTTPPAVKVAAGSAVSIQLISSEGVYVWDCRCIGTDESNDKNTVNAGLTVNHASNSATFTFPSTNGAALIFRSMVNNGIAADGSNDPSLITTFKIYAQTSTLYELGAQNETTESGNFGWLPIFNGGLRGGYSNPTGGAGGDLSATYPNPTVAKIQGNAVQTGLLGAAQDGYVLAWNASTNEYEVRLPALILSTGKVYEFENTASDIATYDVLDGIAGVEADLSVSINSGSGKTLIKSFATAIGSPNITYIPAGQWDFDFYSYVSITAGVTQFIFDVYIRTAGGTETLLFSTTTPDINFTSVTQSSITYSFSSDTNINTTDRVVVKVSAITTSGGTVAAHFVFDGTNHASHFHTPIPGAASILGGDLSGNTGNAKVVSISGASPIPISPAALQWQNTTASPNLSQADLTTSSGTGQTLTIHAQNETGTTSVGGKLVLASGTGTTQAGTVSINAGATPEISIFPGAAGTEIDVGTVDGYVLLVGATVVNNVATTAVNADYTCDVTGGGNWKDAVIICAFTSSHNIKLPNPVTYIGRKVVIKTTGSISTSVTCTIQRYGSENIEGLAANYVIMSPWTKMEFITDGTNWFII